MSRRRREVPHGTRTRYRYGCRCADCREGNALAVRAYRAGLRPEREREVATTLAVTCWCEASVVGVPTADIAAGRTRSCGRTGCNDKAAA